MSSVDNRVVEMKFDNSQFAKGVKDTTKSLDDLKKGLDLEASTRSLEGLNSAGSRFSLASITQGVEGIGSKFSALSIVGIAALASIATKAIDVGTQLVQSLTVAPIKAGFDEYETKLGSIQTILANTSAQGTTLKDVSASLNELNNYADKTIYSFGDMTKNIGLFTNAGINLQDATSMIKGFSNEAAASGTNAAQAAGAAYQLSQALSKGKITLEDWRSLTNNGMGNANMKQGLIDIATAMHTFNGTGATATSVAKDFNGSLQAGWMTADVMTQYLKIQAGELSTEQMKTLGLSDQQISKFITQQKTSEDAATKVRTWTQLVGTMQESVGSGWGTTAELLIGNFNDATTLWTNVNNTLGTMINNMSNARNKLIGDFVNLGGRTVMIDALSLAFKALMDILAPIKKAFQEIFPPATGQMVYDIAVKFLTLTQHMQLNKGTAELIGRTFKGVFAVLDLGRLAVQELWVIFTRLTGGLSTTGGNFLQFTANIGDFLVKVHDSIVNGTLFYEVVKKIGDILLLPVKGLQLVIKGLAEFSSGFQGAITQVGAGVQDTANAVKTRLQPLQEFGKFLKDIWDAVYAGFVRLGTAFKPLGDLFKGLGDAIKQSMQKLDFKPILDFLNTGLLLGIIVIIKKFVDQGMQLNIGGGGFLDSIKEAMEGLTSSLGTMQTTLKAGTLVAIAVALALLVASVVALTLIDQGKLAAALAAMTVMFTQLVITMSAFSKLSIGSNMTNLIAISAAMVILATAIRILTSSVAKLAEIPFNDLLKGLGAVIALMATMTAVANKMPANNANMISTGVGMIAIAAAIKILSSAVADFKDLKWQEVIKGLVGVGALLAALALFTKFAEVNKGAIGQSAGLVLLGTAIKILASAVGDFGKMDITTIGKGLASITLLLTLLTAFTNLAGDSAKMVSAGIGIVIISGAMKILASATKDFGSMDVKTLVKGLVGLGGALALITIAMMMLPPTTSINAVGLVIIAGALTILAGVMKQLGGQSWEQIAKGLVTLAGALLVITLAVAGMSGAVAGALAMAVVCASLALLGPVLIGLGNMSWDNIGRGLTMLGASLLVLGLAALVLTPVLPSLLLLGVAIAALGLGASLAGVGMLAFSAGLAALAVSGAAGTAVLVGMVTSLLGLIPYAFTQLGLGLIAFAKIFIDAGPVWFQAAVVLITSLLTAINTVAPQIVSTLINLIWLLLNTIRNNIYNFVVAGLDILVGFLNGIGNNIGRVVTAATNIIVNFLNGIANNIGAVVTAGTNIIVKFIDGITANQQKVLDSAANCIIGFVNSLATTIETHRQAMQDAGAKLGMAIADGLTGGMASKVKGLADGAADMASKALDAAKRVLNINSPSRAFMEVGAYSAEGFQIGITDNAHHAVEAATIMGQSALDTLKSTISRGSTAVAMSMNMNPTIRPVLDLSAVRRDAAQLSDILATGPTLTLDNTMNKASIVSNATLASKEATVANKNTDVPSTGEKQIVLQQYNTSPVALSEIEIYRQTNNLLSNAKGILSK